MEDEKIHEFVEGKVTEAIKANNAELLQSISGMIDKISDNNKLPVHSDIFSKPTFKRKSNEEQYKQNHNVLQKLEGAEQLLDHQRVNEARTAIIVGKIYI